MSSKEESVGKLPVFVFPETLNFFSDNQSSHKQVLTLYNPYEFALQFKVLCNNPTKYNVVESEGIIKQKCCVDIVVRVTDIQNITKREDKFRIHLYQYGVEKLLGKKDIVAQCTESKEFVMQSVKRSGSSMYDSSEPIERNSRRESVIVQRSLPSLPVIIISLASIIVLMLPTHGEKVNNSFIPDYLFMSFNQKLIAAYILGLVTMAVLKT
ncbi:motile sperm domain-containing protein 1 isoform X1 [Hydra vulgaris]|uniref:motile sperm domain-containing protein 1 isoform X1 n=1 Tax=Hydra vulgaris TaxID=6087 RepID=UPI0002B42C82|nr:motile sperm domain-containing protein 1 [Hydra vulgaris]